MAQRNNPNKPDDEKIAEIENILGYTFEDKALLTRALTHNSLEQDASKNYQSLEFLGDSILDFVVAERLMELNPSAHEGTLTVYRASVVSKEPLSGEVKRLGLNKFLMVGKGENFESISNQTKIVSDIFEAFVGAIFLDGGIDCAEEFILKQLSDQIANCNPDVVHDFKTELNELAAKKSLTLEYVLVDQMGTAHSPTFKIKLKINGEHAGCGVGKSKKIAEQEAARQGLSKLKC